MILNNRGAFLVLNKLKQRLLCQTPRRRVRFLDAVDAISMADLWREVLRKLKGNCTASRSDSMKAYMFHLQSSHNENHANSKALWTVIEHIL